MLRLLLGMRQTALHIRQRYDTTNAVLINLTHPEQSRLLRTPLAKAAGGLGRCEDFSLASTGDPRHRAALSVIQGWARDLKENPREDMPGAQPCHEYMVWWRKRLESEAQQRRTLRVLAEADKKRVGSRSH